MNLKYLNDLYLVIELLRKILNAGSEIAIGELD